MKMYIRKAILASIIALATTVAATPAHATLSGSNPRPEPGSGGSINYIAIMMAVLGY
jgi:hypothetical protein